MFAGQIQTPSRDLPHILHNYEDLIEEGLVRCSKVKVQLQFQAEARPKFCKAIPIPFALRAAVEKDLERQVNNGVLTPVEVSHWATPMAAVPEPNGPVRDCGDCNVTLELDEQAKEVLVVNTHTGETGSVPFQQDAFWDFLSSCDLPEEQVTAGLNGVACYLDDIIVTGNTDAEHLAHLDAVLQRLREYGFRLKQQKCGFLKPEVEYLGQVISAEGFKPSPKKVQLRKDVAWEGSTPCIHAFEKIKRRIDSKGIPVTAANRMQRWALTLLGHAFDILYKPTAQFENADGLSRLPVAPDSDFDAAMSDVPFVGGIGPLQVSSVLSMAIEKVPVKASEIAKATATDRVLSRVYRCTSWKAGLVTKEIQSYKHFTQGNRSKQKRKDASYGVCELSYLPSSATLS
ncbi:uncharacterized protein LOC135385115 [Ornithodoros turicata]|uniref:uncharacterized protein LOC135385115 n=1 Tax=Ornithodoros turicata TaxID=34597 RepID=UPI003138D84B